MPERILKKLSEIEEIEDIIVRGSYAKSNWIKGWSDLDLVIVLKNSQNLEKIFSKIGKILAESEIQVGIDFVYNFETPRKMKEMFKIGYKSPYATLELIKYGKSLKSGKYLKKIRNEKEFIKAIINKRKNFEFIQDYLWHLRREMLKLESDLSIKNVKTIFGLVFLISKRFVNLKHPDKLMEYPEEIAKNFRKLYPNFNWKILEKMVKIRKNFKKYKLKSLKKICYDGFILAEKIYRFCVKNEVWKNGNLG